MSRCLLAVKLLRLATGRGAVRVAPKGSCPYVHDAARVAVCPRWLAGGCGLRDCPLQHVARPELMPICTFFQQVCGALVAGMAAVRMHVNGVRACHSQACTINTWARGRK